MSRPMFDPWSSASPHRRCAYRAFRAYTTSELCTLGTIGTEAEPKSRRVARATGSDWRAETVTHAAKAATAGQCQPLVRHVLAAALALRHSSWLGQLERMGWDPIAIFSVDLSETTPGGLVQSLVGTNLVLATSGSAYLSGKGRIFRHDRQQASQRVLPLIWDAIEHGSLVADSPGVST